MATIEYRRRRGRWSGTATFGARPVRDRPCHGEGKSSRKGTASLMVSYATSMADFVVIPVQGSQLDAKQAARQMKLIKAQERIANRPIPFAVLFTRTIRAMFSYGGTIAGRSNKRVSNLPTTLQNAREFTAEIVDRMRARPSGRCQRPCHLACAFDETLRGGI